MSKNIKIIIESIIVIIVLGVSFYVVSIARTNAENKVEAEKEKANVEQKIEEKKLERIVKINGVLYYDTGKESNELRCGMMDGKITSNVESNEIPTIDNQSNFEGEYGYQGGGGETVELSIDGKWVIFEKRNI